MLAIAEKLAEDLGLTWAFCDTDSMAFAKPEAMSEAEFLTACDSIVQWFDGLNPYRFSGSILKIEKTNHRMVDGKMTDELEPFYCWAIAAKRYVLFNLTPDGEPVLRKASAHGLGHLSAPYAEKDAPESIPAPVVPEDTLGVSRWQHDVWYRIVEATLAGKSDIVKLDDLPGFDRPAVSRYAATTPKLLRWFHSYNHGKLYREQVRPFGFLLTFHPRSSLSFGVRREIIQVGKPTKRRSRRAPKREDVPRVVAPYDTDHVAAAERCFDRKGGDPVDRKRLQTYRHALAQYHLRPEAKFGNGDAFDRGELARQHIVARSVRHIGKEANRWEEQLHLGQDPEAQVEYGSVPSNLMVHKHTTRVDAILESVGERAADMSVRQIAQMADLHYGHLSEALVGKRKPSRAMASKLEAWLAELESEC